MMAAAARPTDLLIGSSLSGRNAELVRAFMLAREAKVLQLPLTQSHSPVALAADITVPIDLPKATISIASTSTRIAYLAVVDILVKPCHYRIQPQATVTLRRIKQQLVTHRDGDDRQLLGGLKQFQVKWRSGFPSGLAKKNRASGGRSMTRSVAIVTGAAGDIGRAIAWRLGG